MPEEMSTIECGNCHKKAHGIYSAASEHAAYIAGFYRVKGDDSPYHRYGVEGESFLCRACLHDRIREERRDFRP